MATTVINEDYCAVSFAYGVSSQTELQVLVQGLDRVWSSVTTPTRTAGWSSSTVQIDLQDVEVMANRSLSFLARLGSESYAALDNITLHPCIDCETPGMSAMSVLRILFLVGKVLYRKLLPQLLPQLLSSLFM